MSAMSSKLIVDCDPGLDDAIMLLTIASQHRKGAVTLLGVTTVAGNVSGDKTSRNARYILDLVGLPDIPVHSGAQRPLIRTRTTDAAAFHGDDGIGNVLPRHYVVRPVEPTAVSTLTSLALATECNASILATGSLTNLALAIEASGTNRVTKSPMTVMGGAFGNPSGNVTRNAEFNFWFDPDAACRLFESDQTIRLVPLDVTERVTLGERHVSRLSSGGPLARFAASLVAASIANHRRELNIDECQMHDALAAATLFDPEIVRFESGEVLVRTDGEFEGSSVFSEHRRPHRLHEVALEVDVERARSWIVDNLLALDS